MTGDSYPFDLGAVGRPLATGSAAAQRWFDRGLAWSWGFNKEEAAACYTRAAAADPDLPMAHWGVAHALGPDYNLPWHLMDRAGRARALEGAHRATGRALAALEARPDTPAAEAALIRALPARYPQAEPIDDMQPWVDAFADAMRAAHRAHPDDLDVAAVFVDALMTRTPWKMWDLTTGRPAEGADTEEARATLEGLFAGRPDAWSHAGLLHLYVHLMEMSPRPERALRQADVLRTLVPDAGHLVHMATHLDVLCGQYHDTLFWNLRAIAADEKYRAHAGELNYYTGYRIHDYHFAIYGAMWLGQYAPALRTARALAAALPEPVLRMESPPMGDFMEAYVAMEAHVLIRFGRWEEILARPLPADPDLYTATTATQRYARGLALAALGRVAEAEAEQARFEAARARVSKRRRVHNNRVIDLLAIAAAMLEGEIAYRAGRFAEAFDHLRRAVALDDGLPYDEPWGWMQPARHALGALLLEQGELAEAEAVYRADLGLDPALPRSLRHPDNVWSLQGLHQCLTRRGETAEAVHVADRLALARARADVEVGASCFCAGRAAG